MLSILFKSHLIRHSGTRREFKDTQRALENLRHSESTQRALWHSDTLAFGGHSGTWRALGHLGTWALKALRHLGTQAIGHLEHSGTWALEAHYLADLKVFKRKI